MRVFVALALLTGCVETSAVQCDGFVCPADKLCDDANHQCVVAEQLEPCVGMPDGMDCTAAGLDGAICSHEVCIASVCGDTFVRGSERCDGENLGTTPTCRDLGWYSDTPVTCKENCTIDETMCIAAGRCGDGMINGPEFCEAGMAGAELSCLDFGYDRGLVSCSGFCQPDFATCESFGFAPVGTGSALRVNGVAGTSANDVWFVGLGGSLHWNGSTWTTQMVGSMFDTSLEDIWINTPTDIWAVGQLGVAAHYDGTTWTRAAITAPNIGLTSVWGSATNNVFAAGESGTILRFNGTAWSAMTSGTTNGIFDLWGAGGRDVYAGGQGSTGGDIHHFDGDIWSDTAVSDTPVRGLDGRSATDVWAVTQGNVSGAEVLHKTTGAFVVAETIAWIDEGDAIAIAGSDRLYIGAVPDVAIVDRGRVWRVPSPNMLRLYAAGENDVWGVTDAGAVRHFTGTTWLADVDVAQGVDGMVATSDTHALAVRNVGGMSNIFYQWNGERWSTIGGPLEETNDMWAAAANDIWIAGNDGIVRRYSGVGFSQPMVTNTTKDVLSIRGLSTSDVWAVGEAGTIIHWNGTSWSAPHTVPAAAATAQLLSVWPVSATKAYAAGFVPTTASVTGVMLEWNGGTTWTQVTLPTEPFLVASMWGANGNDIWATGFGQLLHYDGNAWTSITLPVQVVMYRVAGTAANDVYAIGDGGAMFHYAGARWVPMRADSTDELRQLAVTPHHVFVGSNAGTSVLLKP